MLKSVAFANAATIVAAVYYTVCALFSSLIPGFFVNIIQSWVHTLNLETIKGGNPTLNSNIIGLITFSLSTWVTAYALAFVYNRLIKK